MLYINKTLDFLCDNVKIGDKIEGISYLDCVTLLKHMREINKTIFFSLFWNEKNELCCIIMGSNI